MQQTLSIQTFFQSLALPTTDTLCSNTINKSNGWPNATPTPDDPTTAAYPDPPCIEPSTLYEYLSRLHMEESFIPAHLLRRIVSPEFHTRSYKRQFMLTMDTLHRKHIRCTNTRVPISKHLSCPTLLTPSTETPWMQINRALPNQLDHPLDRPYPSLPSTPCPECQSGPPYTPLSNMLLTHVLPMQLDHPPDQSPPCNVTYVPSQYTLHTWYPVCNNTQFMMDRYGTSPSHAVIFPISWHRPPLSPTCRLSSLTIARTPITSATHPNWKHNLRPP